MNGKVINIFLFSADMPIIGIASLQTAEDASFIQDVDEKPHIVEATGEWHLSINDINSIEIGRLF